MKALSLMKRHLIIIFLLIFLPLISSAMGRKPAADTRETNAGIILSTGVKACQEGNFQEALKYFKGALKLEPKNKSLGVTVKRLKLVVKYVKNADTDSIEDEAIRKGISAHLENNDDSDVLWLKYANYKNPKNKKTLKLLNKIEKQKGLPCTKPNKTRKLDDKLAKIVEIKLSEAKQALNEERYEDSIKICREVISIDPRNSPAWELINNSFYRMYKNDGYFYDKPE